MQTAANNINRAVAGTPGVRADAEPLNVRKRIGSTVYEVRVYFNQAAKETMNDKILRIIRNDLNTSPQDVNMALPQTSRLPEPLPRCVYCGDEFRMGDRRGAFHSDNLIGRFRFFYDLQDKR